MHGKDNKYHGGGKMTDKEIRLAEHQEQMDIFKEKTGIKVDGHFGTWYSIAKKDYNGRTLYIMEHEKFGDEAACVIIDENNKLIANDVWNGFDDYDEWVADGFDSLMEE
jgi:hypothetical protein